jgi:hypothetical protein
MDSGVTENFLNLTYAKWLWLPIKKMKDPWKLYNVDGTENKAKELQYYTNLEMHMGTTAHKLCFFLTDLGEHKAILGYPWFTVVQPNIDWKRGWIDHTQLPIILQAPNTQNAIFMPWMKNVPRAKLKVRYFIGRVTIQPKQLCIPEKGRIPKEYNRHGKVFSEEKSQQLPRHMIWDHAIELLPNAPATLPAQLLPLNWLEQEEMQKFVEEHLWQGTIRESWSPYVANFFFIKKKDGKLYPIQDYQPINKWMKKNWNVSPLIPQTINRLSECTLFTKFDV